MTLLVLRYRRAHAGTDGNSAEMLDEHLGFVRSRFANVLPGEPLPPDPAAVCLCFDAFFDFYATVFPLLQKHSLRALLAVSPGLIRDRTTAPPAARLEIGSDQAYAQPAAAGFCTWQELDEVMRSGLVAVAAHGYIHQRLDTPGCDLETEVHVPQTLLSARLGQPVDSFVFPSGRFTRRALTEARASYRYVFADGNASNAGWNGRVLHRIAADDLQKPSSVFDTWPLLRYRLNALSAAVRRA